MESISSTKSICSPKLFLGIALVLPYTILAQVAKLDTSKLPVYFLEEVVVTATRAEKETFQIPLSISTATQKQIEESQPLTPVEALKYQSGIFQQRDGILASTPIVRGLARERVPILIDGDPFLGGRIRSYALIDPWQIKRIEVIKGPASSIWGSDAVGGLVNIITRRAQIIPGESPHLGGSIWGSFNTSNQMRRGRFEIEGNGYGIDFLAGIGGRHAENMRTPLSKIENSQFESFNWDLRSGYNFNAHHRVELTAKYFKNDNVGFPGGLGAPGPPRVVRLFAPDRQTDFSLRYEGKNFSKRFTSLNVNVFFKEQDLTTDHTVRTIPAGMTIPVRETRNISILEVPTIGGKASLALSWGMRQQLTFGVDFLSEDRKGRKEKVITTTFSPTGTVTSQTATEMKQVLPNSFSKGLAVFALDEIQIFPPLAVMIAMRFDRIQTRSELDPIAFPEIRDVIRANSTSTDNAPSGSVGILYQLTSNTHLIGSIATSFRAADLFSKFNFTRVGTGFLVPNPALDSEKGLNYEIGLKVRKSQLAVETSFFLNQLRDLFVQRDIIFNGAASKQFQNVGKAELLGLELLFRYHPGSRWALFGNLSFLRGNDKTLNQPLPEIPPISGLLGIRFTEGRSRFFIEMTSRLVDKQDRIAPNEIETPGYVIYDLSTDIDLKKIFPNFLDAHIILAISNLTDRSYRNHLTRGSPGNQNTFIEPGIDFSVGFITKF